MSLKSRSRALQKLTGSAYTSCRAEIIKRGLTIKALKAKHPEMTLSDCDAAVCFEDQIDLLSRWGSLNIVEKE